MHAIRSPGFRRTRHWPYLKIGRALAPAVGGIFLKLCVRHPTNELDGDDTGIAIQQSQAVHVAVPILRIEMVRSGDETSATTKDILVVRQAAVHPAFDGVHHFV